MIRPASPDGPHALETLADLLSRSHRAERGGQRYQSFRRRLTRLERGLRRGLELVPRPADSSVSGGRSSEWLLGNDHVVQAALEQVSDALTRAFYRRLPQLTTGRFKGRTRTYGLARHFVAEFEGEVDVDKLIKFISAYQKASPLLIAELWALPMMLRLAVLEVMAEKIAVVFGPHRRDLEEQAPPRAIMSDADVALVNCVVSLQEIATRDWRAFVESVSLVEQALRRDPAGIYSRMDFQTRDSYRRAVERLARATDWRAERWIAQRAVRLAERSESGSSRRRHVGFFLVEGGRAQLEDAIGYAPRGAVRLGRLVLRHATAAYLGATAILTIAPLLVLLAYAAHRGGTAVALAALIVAAVVPASSLASSIVNFIVTTVVKPKRLPKLDFEDGIPDEFGSVVVIPAMLANPSEIESLLTDVEVHFLGNDDPALYFGFLLDFVDAPEQHMPEDDALLQQAVEGIRALNRHYGGEDREPFFLLCRERRYNPAAGMWMGWERKRGKLTEFNRLLTGADDSSYTVRACNLDVVRSARFVITLDADTKLPRTAAASLVGAMAHPLNRPRFDPDTGRVVAGYTVLQPRVAIDPSSVNRTRFARTLAGDLGLDLYSQAVSDVYQDLWGEGNYAGKGIYDPKAFERSLEGRVPDNAVLSHDLFEGIHGRAGLVSDVVVLEDFPANIQTFVRRLHRWVRGDWQLLPWLLPTVPAAGGGRIRSRFSALGRWKIFDNLRRSLLSPSVLLFLLIGWFWLPGSPWVWTAAALGAVGASVLVVTIGGFRRVTLGPAKLPALAGTGWSVRAELLRRGMSLAFLPLVAMTNCDAIVRTLYRVAVSHDHLLEWVPASQAARVGESKLRTLAAWRQMWHVVAATVGIAAVALWVPSGPVYAAGPFVVLWLVSPQLAYWTGRTRPSGHITLQATEVRLLRRIARHTWLFFEHFIGPETHWLPPDHYQESPGDEVAHRTSPTDIGMMLLATLSAYDLGYLGPLEIAARFHNSFDSMDRLERYWGHCLNWYETDTLRPLEPRYVSTVDSGNLAGALLTVARGCEGLLEDSVNHAARREGLVDTLDGLFRVLDKFVPDSGVARRDLLLDSLRGLARQIDETTDEAEWAGTLNDLCGRGFPECERMLLDLVEESETSVEQETLAELRMFVGLVERCLREARGELRALVPWNEILLESPSLYGELPDDAPVAAAWRGLQDALPAAPSLRHIPAICDSAAVALQRLDDLLATETSDSSSGRPRQALRWNRRLAEALVRAGEHAASLISQLERASRRADAMFHAMDFSFLFCPQRRVFHIGFNVAEAALDPNYYDLLASEARLASLLAIAKGDAPQRHWLYLGRPFASVRGRRVLMSWSGTAFEYLMPTLMVQTPEQTLLAESCRAAIGEQIAFGRRRKSPWGISESGYFQFDGHEHYQYRAFGVPSLGLALGLGERLVVAPYASVLALDLRPREVIRNMEVLEGLGMLGRYGFYEAIDYGAQAGRPSGKGDIVRSYMVHHQGMILTAVANCLNDNTMVARFHSDPRVASVEPLVHEERPHGVPLSTSWRLRRPAATAAAGPPVQPWIVDVGQPCPQVNLLSNGSLSLLIDGSGSGTSWRRQVALTRWSPDASTNASGGWVYVHDADSGALWSVGRAPVETTPDLYDVQFGPAEADFRRRENGISVRMQLTVSPSDDVEIRRVTILNESARRRVLTVTSYAEPVLAPRLDDERHPAFSKLFVEGGYDSDTQALLFRRRPRSADDLEIHLGHTVVGPVAGGQGVSWEIDRARFLGRCGSRRKPRAMGAPPPMEAAGKSLDQIMSMSCGFELMPHEQCEVTYITAAAESRRELVSLIEEYRSSARIRRAFRAARERGASELRSLDLTAKDTRSAMRLLSAALYPQPALRHSGSGAVSGSPHQREIWAHGISGDLPIIVASVSSEEDAGFLVPLFRAHALWSRRGLPIDLVVLDEQSGGYAQALRDRVRGLVDQFGGVAARARGGIFLVAADQQSAQESTALRAAAAVFLDARDGPLEHQLDRLLERPRRLPTFVPMPTTPIRDEGTEPVRRPQNLLFDNGLGGFSRNGHEYIIYLEAGSWPPAPWINVIANRRFGFLISESGGGYTWSGNSAENRLTPWANDPVLDRPGEVLYLRDEETGAVWSATPRPAGGPGPYLVRHGAGYTSFEHNSHGLEQRLRLVSHPEEPVKIASLRLTNRWRRDRRITATYYAEWVLGTTRASAAPFIVPDFDAEVGALLARNPFSAGGSPQATAFLASSEPPHGVTVDRSEFLGRAEDLSRPEALFRIGLSGSVHAGLDPCAALQVHVDLAAGETREIHFFLGQGSDTQQCAELVSRLRSPGEISRVERRNSEFWDDRLGAVTVRTPSRSMNVLVNRWLLYQALSCRLWARTALYQSSGAFGFRDQLQDVMALLFCAPELARDHILEAARHQFGQGDVLHWWHPPATRGVRTHCSDDLLWLPYVTARYVAATGDRSILDEEIPFLTGPPLPEDGEDHYAEFETSSESACLYEHCLRAIDKGSTRGPHGLPLIGSGDWNDGLNRVGIAGVGESVWLGWFSYATLQAFAPLCEGRGDDRGERFREEAARLRDAIESSAWDGGWYLRAFFDDGTPLGSNTSPECRIDATSQAWAVMSGAGSPARCARAMRAADEWLVRDDDRLVSLLTPPFDRAPWDPGYIKAYPPGVRENGGQYTHAAIWLAWAFADLGDGDLAKGLFELLNPINRTTRPAGVERYQVEPYAISADVYSEPPFVGRGGWTWYTGAAAWMYRLAIERILGLQLRDGRIRLDPCIPKSWEQFAMQVRYRGAEYDIEIENPTGVNRGVASVEFDGRPLEGRTLPASEPGRHTVRAVLGVPLRVDR